MGRGSLEAVELGLGRCLTYAGEGSGGESQKESGGELHLE